jgi:hypothetical protein
MSEANEARQFFESLHNDFDPSAPLGWNFMLDGATEDQVEPLMDTLAGMGFTNVEPMEDDEQEGRYTLWVQEVCVHTAESFANRVAAVEQLASREGLVVSDYSAGLFEGVRPRVNV